MKLREIVDQINVALQVKLNQKRFQQGQYFGLARLVSVKQADDTIDTLPTIFTDSGLETVCDIDDTYSFQIYHRCESITQEVFSSQFGDGNNTIKENCNMIAVVYAKKSIIGMCQEDLASIISSSFPSTLSITDISSVVIKTNQVNNNSFDVYNQEYKSADYPLNPEDYFFNIQYTVETTFDKSCVDRCIC